MTVVPPSAPENHGMGTLWRLVTWLPRNFYRMLHYVFFRRRRSFRTLARQTAIMLRTQGAAATCRTFRDHIIYSVRKKVKLARDEHKFCLFLTNIPPGAKGGDSGRYRCVHQAQQMDLLGLSSQVLAYGDVDLRDALEHFDFFILHRVPADEDLEEFAAAARERGIPIAYDTDDLVFAPEASSFVPELRAMSAKQATFDRQNIARRYQALALCDCAIVSTNPLAEWTRRLFPGKQVYVNKNVMNRAFLAAAEDSSDNKARPQSVTYISGSKSHDIDFLECVPALARLLGDLPELKLLIVGHLQLPDCLVQYERQIEQTSFIPWLQVPEFLRRTWVNLAPLESGNPFNDCKSALKYFEAAPFGVPTVASDVPAFSEDICDGVNGFLCRDSDEWHEKTKRLLTDDDLRISMGRQARDDVLVNYSPETRSRNLETILQDVFGDETWNKLRNRYQAAVTFP